MSRRLRIAWLLLLVSSCAGTRNASERASSPSTPAPAICAAVYEQGPLRQRFEKHLPLRVGGVVWVLRGADPHDVERTFASLELSGTRVVGCDADRVVAWAPGVDENAVPRLEAAMRSNAPNVNTLEREIVAPQAAR